MAIKKLPLDETLVIETGETFSRTWRWLPGGEPYDFTGWVAHMPVGPTLDDVFFEFTMENNEITLDTEGKITIEISAEKVSEIMQLYDVPTKKHTGNLFYNLVLTDPFGKITMFMKGTLVIEHNVPRPK